MAGDQSPQKTRGRPKTMKRQEVIGHATALYWREGYPAISLNELCRRLSISKPSLYREFGGEDGLVNAVLSHYREAVIKPFLSYLKLEQPFAELLEALIVGMTAPREFPPGCLFTEMRLIRTHLGPASMERLDSIEEERRTAFEHWYEKALSKGEVNPDITAAQAASFIDAQFTLILLHMGQEYTAERVQQEARLAMSILLKS